MTAKESNFTGSLFMVMGPFPSWPAFQQERLCQHIIEKGVAELYAMPDSTIKLVLRSKEGHSAELETCPIITGPQTSRFIFSASWDCEKVDLHINGYHVAATDPTKNTEVSVQWSSPVSDSEREIFMNISQDNERCRDRRKDEARSLTAKTGRIVTSSDKPFLDLDNAIKQLNDQITAIRRGELYQDTALATRLRALICRPRSQTPLLQRCAGELNHPLTLWCIPPLLPQFWDPCSDEQLSLHLSISIDFSPEKISETQVPMDIDFWLQKKAARHQSRCYTNDEVIRAFADTEAAHYDVGMEPLVNALKSVRTGTNDMTMLHNYFLMVAECVVRLGSGLLFERASVDCQDA
jgi:hypothetical protein